MVIFQWQPHSGVVVALHLFLQNLFGNIHFFFFGVIFGREDLLICMLVSIVVLLSHWLAVGITCNG